jgi:outer membrane lipoprotein SlyB
MVASRNSINDQGATMNIKHPLSVLTLALAAALPLSLPVSVQAQPRPTNQAYNGPAFISTIGVEQVRRLSTGNVLAFTLEGAPRAEVTLRIDGATAPLRLTERRPGVYEGNYTIRSRDRLNANSVVTAQVYKEGQSATATLSRSLLLGARDLAPLPATQITAFTVNANDRVRPGDEVGFSMTGTPGGKASVAVQGVTKRIPLTEVRRGVYEGTYVVRREDRLRGELQADGYLQFDRREMSQRYERQVARQEAQEQRREDRRDERDDLRAAREAREARETEAVRLARQQAQFCAACGSIESINVVEVQGDNPNVIGTIAGGVLGGVIGNQVGGGSGKDIARVIGAIGGAYAGNRIENNMDKRRVFRVAVRLEGGTVQNFDYADDPRVAVGTRVKVENGVLLRL